MYNDILPKYSNKECVTLLFSALVKPSTLSSDKPITMIHNKETVHLSKLNHVAGYTVYHSNNIDAITLSTVKAIFPVLLNL